MHIKTDLNSFLNDFSCSLLCRASPAELLRQLRRTAQDPAIRGGEVRARTKQKQKGSSSDEEKPGFCHRVSVCICARSACWQVDQTHASRALSLKKVLKKVLIFNLYRGLYKFYCDVDEVRASCMQEDRSLRVVIRHFCGGVNDCRHRAMSYAVFQKKPGWIWLLGVKLELRGCRARCSRLSEHRLKTS